MEQKTFRFTMQAEGKKGSDVVLDQETTEALVVLMASALIAVVIAVAEASDAR